MAGLLGRAAAALKRIAAPKPRRCADNISVKQGLWGEDAAVRDLEKRGCSIVARRVRPSARDRRLEIDIIAREKGGTLLFVEVKTHKRHSARESALPAIDRAKKNNLRRACLSWLRASRFSGKYVFCVYEIYGDCEKGGDPDEIRYVRNVPLFTAGFRFR